MIQLYYIHHSDRLRPRPILLAVTLRIVRLSHVPSLNSKQKLRENLKLKFIQEFI